MADFKAVMLHSALEVQMGCIKRRIGKERGERTVSSTNAQELTENRLELASRGKRCLRCPSLSHLEQ